MQVFPTSEVFTPTKPARLTFVERSEVNDRLVNALSTPGKQVVVYGHSGSGKTTLLVNKLHQLYERHITTRCTRGTTFDQVILDAFDQLAPFYLAEQSRKDTRRISPAIEAKYSTIKFQLCAERTVEENGATKRMLPPQLTAQTLARLLGEAHACWLLEDFHKVDTAEKVRLAQSMKVFMDMADEYPDLKIVALGAVDTARQVIEYDDEMRNRVSEIYVPLMSESELRQLIKKGEEKLNIAIADGVCNGIVRYSNGLAAVCHSLCLNMCNSVRLVQTAPESLSLGRKELRAGLEQYLQEASDTLKAVFDKALRRKKSGKFDNCRIVLEALAHFDQEGSTNGQIISEIHKRHHGYPSGNCTYYLDELQGPDRGSIIRHDPVSGRFSFSDPIFRAFAVTMFEKDHEHAGALEDTFDFSLGELQKELELLVVQFRAQKKSPTSR